MRLEEAMVYVLASSGRGMTTSGLAESINRQRLHLRADGRPVTDRQVYAVVCRNRAVFVNEAGRIWLAM